MIILFSIIFQSGEFHNESSKLIQLVPIFVSLIAVAIAYFAARFQGLSLIQNQIANKAKECNENIDKNTQRILNMPQNISHIVSTIINTEKLIDRIIKRKGTFFFFKKTSLIDQLYLQLHTSIIDYISQNTITPDFEEGQVKFHIKLQLDYCHRLFSSSIKEYGNATPKEIKKKLNEYKK
jgi:hypothetical protein